MPIPRSRNASVPAYPAFRRQRVHLMNHTEIQRQPTLYIPHGGGPCFFMDWNPPDTWDRMSDFLRGVVATLPCRRRAVRLIPGHWRASAFSIGSRPDQWMTVCDDPLVGKWCYGLCSSRWSMCQYKINFGNYIL